MSVFRRDRKNEQNNQTTRGKISLLNGTDQKNHLLLIVPVSASHHSTTNHIPFKAIMIGK